MSGISRIALAGVGAIGKFIADELIVAKKAGDLKEVIILTRAGSSNKAADEYAAKGAKVVSVDYTDATTLRNALSGANAVVSTLNGAAGDAQLALAKASAAAGASVFVPSDFGDNNEGLTEGLFGAKYTFLGEIKKLGLHYTTFYTGLFADYCFIPPVGFDFENGKVTIAEDGNTPVSTTLRSDVARYVVHALAKFPPEHLHNRILRIEGSRKTFNEIIKIYEKKHGKKIDITYTPIAELEARVKKNPLDILSLLHIEWARGRGAVGEPVDNGKWPEWNPKPIEELL